MRRQGRAAIAAQAAAESCLEALRAQAEADESDEPEDRDDGGDDDAAAQAVAAEGARWLKALIPVVDALDRVASQAAPRGSGQAASRPRRWLLDRLLPAPDPAPDDGGARAAALDEGLRLLRAQLEGTLRDLGVSVDRRTGAAVDGERQRVVELRRPRPGERRGTVVEVVRPGYALGSRTVREAEVVVADDGNEGSVRGS